MGTTEVEGKSLRDIKIDDSILEHGIIILVYLHTEGEIKTKRVEIPRKFINLMEFDLPLAGRQIVPTIIMNEKMDILGV